MFEYRWAEVAVGEGPDDALSRLGLDGWEAVGLTVTGQHFNRTYVRVLLKRALATAAPQVIDVAAYEREKQRYDAAV